MGPLMLDLHGYELSATERELLQHPTTGGVILFTRNYADPQQLMELTRQIRRHSKHHLLLAVDHEGGRVQRFREGFSPIPAMGKLYTQAGEDLQLALHYARQLGYLMAIEVLAVGIDISFAPVLDLWGPSTVIGARSFHQQPQLVIDIGGAFIDGMNDAGMAATGKHFPGHGNVVEDTHVAVAVDRRPKEQIYAQDLSVFAQLVEAQKLGAMMPAHVIYPAIDENLPAGFSPKWIKQILRQELQFDGVIFSDDLSMHGASVMGGYSDRAKHALDAGCDMVLACNNQEGAIAVLDGLPIVKDRKRESRLARLLAQNPPSHQSLKADRRWIEAQQVVELFA